MLTKPVYSRLVTEDRTPYETNMHLDWEPQRPQVTYWVISGDVLAAWKVYLLAGDSARQDGVKEDDTE